MRRPALRVTRLSIALLTLALVMVSGCLSDTDSDLIPDTHTDLLPDPELLKFLEEVRAMPELRFETDHGTIRMILFEAWTPHTVAHIGGLADRGFYDGTIVHRVVDDFVIQGGDPSGTGQLGSGQTVAFESDARLHFAAGSVGLARDLDPNSGDSQWFIAETPQPHLTNPTGPTGAVFGSYTLFGQVFEGLDVVRAINAEPTIPGLDRPITDVVLNTAHLLPPPADLDALGLVRALDAGIEWNIGFGTLDHPLWMVAGHPVHMLVHDVEDTGESFDPRKSGWGMEGAEPVYAEWSETSDPGTWEARVVFPVPGTWTLSATDACHTTCTGHTLEVLPWNDAYA